MIVAALRRGTLQGVHGARDNGGLAAAIPT
eukprot:SAG11_NODE_2467_length_3323_cov_1.721774_1_plen_30_part_00